MLLLTAAPKPGWRKTPGTPSLYLRQNKTTPNKPTAAACSKFLPTATPFPSSFTLAINTKLLKTEVRFQLPQSWLLGKLSAPSSPPLLFLKLFSEVSKFCSLTWINCDTQPYNNLPEKAKDFSSTNAETTKLQISPA